MQSNQILSQKLVLGVPGTGSLLQQWQEKSPALFKDVNFTEYLKDPLYGAWLNKIIRPQTIITKLQSQTGRTPQDVDLNLDVTKLTPVKPILTDPSASIKADVFEPSIIFATLTNSYEGLTSLHITKGVTQIAAGYQDCSVRVWRIDQENVSNEEDVVFGKALKKRRGAGYEEILPCPKENWEEIHRSRSILPSERPSSSLSSNKSKYPAIDLIGHSFPVTSVAQSDSGRLVYSSAADETIRLWDTSLLQCVGKYSCLSVPWEVDLSPIEGYFASANQDATVTVYSTTRKQPIRMMTGHMSDVNTVRWHGNGVLLASGSDDRCARLWDIRSAECVRAFRNAAAPISCIDISSLGNIIAAGAENGKIYLWDIRSSRLLGICQGHEGTVHSISFSGDADAICSGGSDCSVRIWDILPALDTSYLPAPGSFNNESASMGQYALQVLNPRQSFFTKASPVYKVSYTAENMIYCGGSYSETAASCKSTYIH